MPTRDVNESWATAVRRRMRDRGLAGPSELARASGVDQSVISRWMNEGRTPTVDALRRVASPLGASLRDLLIESGHATEEELPLGSLAQGTAVSEVQDVDVAVAIEHDQALLPEAKAHLLNQYELLLRLQEAAPPSLVRRQEERRHLAAVTKPSEGEEDVVQAMEGQPRPLAYVARTRDGKPVVSDPETEERLAREIDEAVKANPHARKRRK